MHKPPQKQPHQGDYVLWTHTVMAHGTARAMLEAENTPERRVILKAAELLRDLVAPLLPESHR